MGIKAQKRKPTTGTIGIIDEIGKTITELNPEGKIYVHGEIWDAESLEGNISADSKVIVKEISNMILKVRKAE